MGCDISSWAEVRETGVWRMVECDGPTGEPFSDRNYATFAILAGVRNYGGCITPIAEPRGWPEDATPEGKEKFDWLNGDAHSKSWHSLRHLLEYPLWSAAFTEERVIEGSAYAALKKGEAPEPWWEPHLILDPVVDEDQLARALSQGNDVEDLYVKAKRTIPYRKVAGEFITEAIPRLLALASPHPDVVTMANLAIAGEKTALLPLQDWLMENDRPGLDDVRMVFCFDH